ncbi:MAG: ATP-dependent helicase [Chloroflexi bacterium]|nr:ATP-dependent helicase [Chloroflexota bacterium]
MRDEEVLGLDSDEPLVVVEAPAGCGKTYQAAAYAKRAASRLTTGRVLILTHTHAGCAAFAEKTHTVHRRVEIRTLDSFIVQIARAYHKSLDLPDDPAVWARQEGEGGYASLASRVAKLFLRHPFIAVALTERFPVVVADEHQDTNAHQHAIVIALQEAGAKLRIFGDPMQGIFSRGREAQEAMARWEEATETGRFAQLCRPHRWRDGTPALGDWVLQARQALKDGAPIDLTGGLPAGLTVRYAENAAGATQYRLSYAHRRSIDDVVNAKRQLLVLTPQNSIARALTAFWNRAIPLWEGHTRPALDQLLVEMSASDSDPVATAGAVRAFLAEVAVGCSPSIFGDRLVREVEEGCSKKTRGKPKKIQDLGRIILNEPGHAGMSKLLVELARLSRERTKGFENVKIDCRREYNDAIRLGSFEDVDLGMAEIHRRRSFSHPMPPPRAISTIHKAKGLQCDNVLLIPCDSRISTTHYSRCRLYVAISRAKCSLTIVLSRDSPCKLFRTAAT